MDASVLDLDATIGYHNYSFIPHIARMHVFEFILLSCRSATQSLKRPTQYPEQHPVLQPE